MDRPRHSAVAEEFAHIPEDTRADLEKVSHDLVHRHGWDDKLGTYIAIALWAEDQFFSQKAGGESDFTEGKSLADILRDRRAKATA